MPRTFFQNFNRDDGTPVTVQYSASGGESNFDHPGHICDGGGSGPEFAIVSSWPNTPEYNALVCDRNALAEHYFPPHSAIWPLGAHMCKDGRINRMNERIAALEAACKLTDAEDERMCAWLAEHHVDEPDDDLCF
jgi:hypothetical protein